MSLRDEFSPNVTIGLINGKTVSFKRMLVDDWADYQDKVITQAKIDANAKVTKENPGKDWKELAERRAFEEDRVESKTTFHRIFWDSINNAKAAVALLKFARVDGELDCIQLIPMTDVLAIAEKIACVPVVVPDPQKPSGENVGDAGSGQPSPTPTGDQDQNSSDSPSIAIPVS